jgi:hypothetical protein
MSAVAARAHACHAAAAGVRPGGHGVYGRDRAVVALRLPHSLRTSPSQRDLRRKRSDAYSSVARRGSRPGGVTVNADARDAEVADSNPARGGQDSHAEFVVLNPDQVHQLPAAAESGSSSGPSSGPSASSSGSSSPKGQRPKRSPEEFADLVPPSERRGLAAASLSASLFETSCHRSCTSK